MKKFLKTVKLIFIIWMIYIVVMMTVPPLYHKVPEEYSKTSDESGYPQAQERVLSIDNNQDALLWRLRLIEAATERIVLTTFDFCDDNSGQDIMSALYHAADRGVKVQIIVDGINGVRRLSNSRNFQELAGHENVEVKFYNPVSILLPSKNNYRMHDKYLIADNFAYILGGRNTNDLFLGNYVETYNEDRDILVYETTPGEGNSYLQLEEYFEQIWNLPCCKQYKKSAENERNLERHYQELRQTYPEAFIAAEWDNVTIETDRIELCTNSSKPENKTPQLWARLTYEMRQGDNILIQTPYIICSKKMYQDMTEICSEGANVEVMINAVENGSNPFGCTDYLNQKNNVLATGMTVYEYSGLQALHTKTILVGQQTSIVGSCNLDMRSVYLDTEMMLVIESEELNTAIRNQIETTKEESIKVSPEGTVAYGDRYEPKEQGIGKKLLYLSLRILIIPFRHLL
jgi:phosphatidylserine/phosphatidylglycerophosphate/cardiolipin synthase-like enzyme